MDLVEVISVKKTPNVDVMNVVVKIRANGEEYVTDLAYTHNNIVPMQQQIYEWLLDHPGFEFEDSEQTDPVFSVEAERTRVLNNVIQTSNNVTSSILMKYPTAEVQSWTIQKIEAEAFLGAWPNVTVAIAPFVTSVCSAEFGPATDPVRKNQVYEKCLSIKANANAWEQAAAAINGIRARVQYLLNEANTKEVILAIEADALGKINSILQQV